MPRLGVPSTTDSPLCAWRIDPLTAADELPKNHRPGSTFARIFEGPIDPRTRIFEGPIDPRKGTKGRHIDGSELGCGIKGAFFQAPPRWRRAHFFTGITRTTILIGEDGRIARIWRKVRVDGHAAEVLAAAQAL
jgi:hypothetical protein